MSAAVFVAYYGIRYDIAADSLEVDHLECGTHPLMVLAAQAELDCWWSGLPNDGETSYPVFVGKQIALVGVGYDQDVRMSASDLLMTMQDVQEKLAHAGIKDAPALLLQVEIP